MDKATFCPHSITGVLKCMPSSFPPQPLLCSMQEKRVSNEDIQEAGPPHTFTNEAVGEWLEAVGGEWVFVDEGGEADAAEGSEVAAGSKPAAQCQGVEATAETYKHETRGLESRVTWLCGNRMSAGATQDEMVPKLDSSKEELKTLWGKVSMSCIDEYHKQDDAFFEAFFEATDVTPKRDVVKQERKALIRRWQEEFAARLDAIRVRLKEIYQIMLPGGNAVLAPVDPLDPFSQGIRFCVCLPQQQCSRNIVDLDG
ncbi:unnamed protein product [Closterium sp. NIES-53]